MSEIVVDSLVLELGVDLQKLTAGAREALDELRKYQDEAAKDGTQIEAQTKRSFDLLLDLRREALVTLGVFLGGKGVMEFAGYITNLDAATGRLSKTIDMNVSDVSAWQGALKEMGGSADDANSALAGLSGAANMAMATGQISTGLALVGRLVGGLRDSNGELKTSAELWLELSKAVQGMDPAQAKALLSLVPGANPAMINFALTGRDAMQSLLDVNKATGVATAQSSAEAQKFQTSLGLLRQAADNAGRSIMQGLYGPLTFVTDKMREFISLHPFVSAGAAAIGGGAAVVGGIPFAKWLFGGGAARAAGSVIGKGAGFLTSLPVAALTAYFGSASPLNEGEDETARQRRVAAATAAATAAGGTPPPSSNWTNYLSGLSYLETSQTGEHGLTSSAEGFFQFMPATAGQAVQAGIPDPRTGSYDQQMASTMAWIRKFKPDAAAAIDRGDFDGATRLLRDIWPSLPGGSQSQSAARYRTFAKELMGAGPRPPGATPGAASAASASQFGPGAAGATSSRSTTVTTSIGQITVNAPKATDASGVAHEIGPALKRTIDAGSYNYGPN